MNIYIVEYETNKLVGRYGTIEEYKRINVKKRVLAPSIDAVRNRFKEYNKLSVVLDENQVMELDK